MKKWFLLLMTTLLLTALAACGKETPLPTPIPSSATEETVVEPTAEATEPTEPAPAETPTLPPPLIITPTAASTPITAEETAADEPVVLMTAADFGDNRNPLTGELVEALEDLAQRPLAIKISNSPPGQVRPQSGLNDAAIIVEHLAEGAVTRLTGIFYGNWPEKVGPVRSARLIDLELPAMYDAGLAYSGASVGVSQRLFSSDFRPRIIRSNTAGYYRSGEENRDIEHTLYVNPTGLHDTLAERDLNTPPNFNTVMAFASEPPENGEPATHLTIDYIWEVVEWKYDEENGRYNRWADGEPIYDANDGEQAHTANIIIITPYHVQDANICEQASKEGECLALSVQIQLWGSGPGILMRDGQQFPIFWHREGRYDLLTFSDGAGNPVPLQIGNTWFQIVPNWRGYEKAVVIE
ncbi:MAG: hypothetical protein CSB13_02935 [Chloroflexi bacterium]|nr:MAG: hypothetical protein CSB13_02935 [Chloroflexota bacterium]